MATFKRFLVAADNHGELVSREAITKLLAFAETWQPHYRIHLGDLWDFSPLRGGATPEERAAGISEDYAAGLNFLDAFKPQFLTLGNHDNRIWRIGSDCSNGVLREHCAELADASEREFRRRKIAFVPYQVGKYLQMPDGGPKLLHGFRSSAVSPAKLHYQDWGACLHGHVHKPDTYVATHADGGQALSVACLADLDKLAYANQQPGKMGWRNGFAFGLINTKTGAWQGWHAIKEGSDWISPHGIL